MALNPAIMNRVKQANHREELHLRQQLQQIHQTHAGTMGQMNQDYMEVLQDLRSQRYQELRNAIRKKIERKEAEAQREILSKQMSFFHIGDSQEGQRAKRRGSRVTFSDQGQGKSASFPNIGSRERGDLESEKSNHKTRGLKRSVTVPEALMDIEEEQDDRDICQKSHTAAPLVAFRLNSDARTRVPTPQPCETAEEIEKAFEEECTKRAASARISKISRHRGAKTSRKGEAHGQGGKMEFYIAPQSEDARKKKVQHDVSRLACIRKAEQVEAYQGALRRSSLFIRGPEADAGPSTLGEKFLQKEELDKEEALMLEQMKQRRSSVRPGSPGREEQ